MQRLFSALLLLAAPSVGMSEEMTFKDLLKNVHRREPRTGAIVSVKASAAKRAEGAPATYSNFEVQIEVKRARVEIYNNYLTGKQGESLTFPLGPEIKAEYERLRNLARLQELDKAVADAERRRRIFVLSEFKLQEGSDVKQVEATLGKPRSVTHWMKAGWNTLVYPGVNVVIAFGKVHDIQSHNRK